MSRRPSLINFLLVAIPLGLVCAIAVSIWIFARNNSEPATREDPKFAHTVSASSLADDFRKLTTLIPTRHPGTPAAAKNLTRAAAMIDGTLGPSNTGYQILRIPGPASWPILTVSLPGKRESSPPVWIVTSYDTRAHDSDTTGSAALAATLAAARALASETPRHSLHFAFLPHGNHSESPLLETADLLRQHLANHPAPHALLCIDSFGNSPTLALGSRDTAATPLSLIDGLGHIEGAESICLTDDSDPASILFEMNLPAVRVSTPSADPPTPQNLAKATNRLVTLIRRCASEP